MAARRCAECVIAYPSGFATCNACGGALDYVDDASVDQNYAALARAAKERLELLAQRQAADETEDGKVALWRLRQALELGLPVELAEIVSETARVDLHELESLVRVRGCPPGLALDILL